MLILPLRNGKQKEKRISVLVFIRRIWFCCCWCCCCYRWKYEFKYFASLNGEHDENRIKIRRKKYEKCKRMLFENVMLLLLLSSVIRGCVEFKWFSFFFKIEMLFFFFFFYLSPSLSAFLFIFTSHKTFLYSHHDMMKMIIERRKYF